MAIISMFFQNRIMLLIDRVEGLLDLIVTSKAFKPLKIRFETSTIVLTNVTTFGVAVGATVFTGLQIKIHLNGKNHLILL